MRPRDAPTEAARPGRPPERWRLLGQSSRSARLGQKCPQPILPPPPGRNQAQARGRFRKPIWQPFEVDACGGAGVLLLLRVAPDLWSRYFEHKGNALGSWIFTTGSLFSL